MKTYAKWLEDDEAQMLWRRTWDEPHMKDGLEVLLLMGLPRPELPPAGFDPIAFNATQNTRREGYFNFAANIDLLKQAPKPPAPIEDAPWQHIEDQMRQGAELPD